MAHGSGQKIIKVGVVVALMVSVGALVSSIAFRSADRGNQVNNSLTYDEVAPLVGEYLTKKDIVNAEGLVVVPNTSSNDSSRTVEMTVEDAITQLVADGKLEYLKGDKGDAGARGANGSDGADGKNGVNGSAVGLASGSGLSYSGGVLSLKSCAVDQVLSYDGTTWDCATVTAGGVDDNTTTLSASLVRSGEMLHGTITDSEGNVVDTNHINIADAVFSSSRMSTYATTARVDALNAKVSELEVALDDYATQDWVVAENYLTSSGLASYLSAHGYVTDSTLGTILSSYLLKNDFAATLNTHLLAGNGIDVTEDGNGNSVISSLHNAEIFVITEDHLTVADPDVNKIYVDTSTDPMGEWFYLNGANGAPTDPSDSAAWSHVGALSVDLAPYSTTTQMNTAINNALTNQLNDLANHSDLNNILTNYVKTGDMNTAIADATSDMATETWVNAQGFLTNSALVGNATEAWVNSQNFAKKSDLATYYTTEEVDGMLAEKAAQSDLDATNMKVSEIDATLNSALTSKQDKLTAGQNITISGNVIAANVNLDAYATKTYVDNQDFVTNAAALSTYATKDFVEGEGFITNAALAGYATEDWVTTKGYLTDASLTGYAKQSWVDANYLTTAGLESYLTNNNYAQDSDITAAIAGADDEYVSHSEFGATLHANIKAGSGIAIGADNTISATMFVMTTNRLTVTDPDPSMIYVETGADDSSPVSQYMYLNGANGAPTDPSNPSAWLKIGELSGVDLSTYSTTDQMNTAISDAIEAQVEEFNKTYATQSWVDGQGYLKSGDLTEYATEEWVSENYLPTSALSGYATEAWVSAQKYIRSSDLSGYAMQSWVTGQGYLTSASLVGNATQDWVRAQQYLTTDAAKATYVLQSDLPTTLTAYQPLITGGASTITSANLTAGMILQSNTDGKVAASGVSLSSLQTALSDIAALKTQQASNVAAISGLQKNSSLGSWGEVDTGKTFRGKPVYRTDFTLYINADANAVADIVLNSTANYVDDIISAGGWWSIGYQTERHQLPDAGDGSNYAYVMIYGSNNQLYFRSKANNKRTSATAIIIVEYTKK